MSEKNDINKQVQELSKTITPEKHSKITNTQQNGLNQPKVFSSLVTDVNSKLIKLSCYRATNHSKW